MPLRSSDPYMSQLNNFPQQHTSSGAPSSQRSRRMSGVSTDSQRALKRTARYDSGIQQPFAPDCNNESSPHQDYPAAQSYPHGPEFSSSAPGMKPPQAGVGFMDMRGEPETERSTVGYENNRPQYVAEDGFPRQNYYQRMSGSEVMGAPNTRPGPQPVSVIPLTANPPPMNYPQPPLSVPMLPGNRCAPHVTSPLAASTIPTLNPHPSQLEVLKVQLERDHINSGILQRQIDSNLEEKHIYWARVGEFVTRAANIFQTAPSDPSWFDASVQQYAQVPEVLQPVISTAAPAPAPAPASFPSAPSSVSYSAPGGV
ncbi:hypothetical protein RSOLAG22IIIB_04773 [Rhizoctonia solani]|uniref:Uncharacterized protein n=1 Tax=Rhizoctonia solani TaxID=456999 RepID=A0A0K6G0D7_9AGAM|nr:hypothetical protein RSOLAG22IIIB_04773 [Rhizoctonia solani]